MYTTEHAPYVQHILHETLLYTFWIYIAWDHASFASQFRKTHNSSAEFVRRQMMVVVYSGDSLLHSAAYICVCVSDRLPNNSMHMAMFRTGCQIATLHLLYPVPWKIRDTPTCIQSLVQGNGQPVRGGCLQVRVVI